MSTIGRMDPLTHAGLRNIAKQAENVEGVSLKLEAAIRQFQKDGWPPNAHLWSTEQLPALRKIRDQEMKKLASQMNGTDLYSWQQATTGIGNAIFFVIGLLPPLCDFHSVAGVWKYCGLHVSDGAAARPTRGKTLGYSPRLRAYVMMRVADPAMKRRACPYRAVYDARRARTAETHPVMLVNGSGCATCDRALAAEKGDCASLGGSHWSLKHQHMDALRVTAKAILRDAWRVDRGLPARYAMESEPWKSWGESGELAVN